MPVSAVFRGKLIEELKDLYYKGKLTIPDSRKDLRTSQGFEKWLSRLVSQKWRVHSKPPFSGPKEVVRYIGRYTHSIVMNDSRIISAENGEVRFSYKDNREKDKNRKRKEMTLPAEEFMRRFLSHVLPTGYHRIRNYGFLANGKKRQNLEKIREQLPNENESYLAVAGDESMLCPVCKKGRMKTFFNVNGFGKITKSDISVFFGKKEEYDTL